MKLNKNALANTLALFAVISYLACVLATILFPELLFTLFDGIFHGVSLASLKPGSGDWLFDTGNMITGLAFYVALSWISGYLIATLYNTFSDDK